MVHAITYLKRVKLFLKKFEIFSNIFKLKFVSENRTLIFLAFGDHLRKNKDIGVKPFFSFICPTNVRLYTHTLSEYSNRSNLESSFGNWLFCPDFRVRFSNFTDD